MPLAQSKIMGLLPLPKLENRQQNPLFNPLKTSPLQTNPNAQRRRRCIRCEQARSCLLQHLCQAQLCLYHFHFRDGIHLRDGL
ncbi:hypothetical protein BC937DRAFT_94868 [Endogone sp. FLAS-F59071]|nr:hypothetical protein BC937DRAFT_94868 [Endogone sp. FLAS-F59071]|eukprot:RUS13733.1 hypothetical protein BC937DRAFT_94868 [Endogone sp. FLAS-F59071]